MAASCGKALLNGRSGGADAAFPPASAESLNQAVPGEKSYSPGWAGGCPTIRLCWVRLGGRLMRHCAAERGKTRMARSQRTANAPGAPRAGGHESSFISLAGDSPYRFGSK